MGKQNSNWLRVVSSVLLTVILCFMLWLTAVGFWRVVTWAAS